MAQHRPSSSITPDPPGETPSRGALPIAAPPPEFGSVGRRLREIRASRALSLRALAETSGLNINTLSLIENERTSPSVSTLQQLARSLDVPMTEFFRAQEGSLEIVHQQHEKRPRIPVAVGTMEDLASGMRMAGAQPLVLTLQRGANSGKAPIVHTGREFVYCIQGRITYTVQDREYLLEGGDSLCFEAYLPHCWRNAGAQPARILLVLCPTDMHDSPKERHFLK